MEHRLADRLLCMMAVLVKFANVPWSSLRQCLPSWRRDTPRRPPKSWFNSWKKCFTVLFAPCYDGLRWQRAAQVRCIAEFDLVKLIVLRSSWESVSNWGAARPAIGGSAGLLSPCEMPPGQPASVCHSVRFCSCWQHRPGAPSVPWFQGVFRALRPVPDD